METLNIGQSEAVIYGFRAALVLLPLLAGIVMDAGVNFERNAAKKEKLRLPYCTITLGTLGILFNVFGLSPQ